MRVLLERKELRELRVCKNTGMNLLEREELIKVLDVILQYSTNHALSLEFIFNVDLGSLSINFIQNEEKVFWYLFQDEKLNKANLNKLKKSINNKYEIK